MLWSLRPALLIAFGSYPIVASAAFQAFACESLGDVSMRYLPPSYSLECGPPGEPTAEYERLTTVAGLLILPDLAMALPDLAMTSHDLAMTSA